MVRLFLSGRVRCAREAAKKKTKERGVTPMEEAIGKHLGAKVTPQTGLAIPGTKRDPGVWDAAPAARADVAVRQIQPQVRRLSTCFAPLRHFEDRWPPSPGLTARSRARTTRSNSVKL